MFQARGLGCNKVNNLQPRSPQTPSYAFAHLISPRTMGVHCAMKWLIRPAAAGPNLRIPAPEQSELPRLYKSRALKNRGKRNLVSQIHGIFSARPALKIREPSKIIYVARRVSRRSRTQFAHTCASAVSRKREPSAGQRA